MVSTEQWRLHLLFQKTERVFSCCLSIFKDQSAFLLAWVKIFTPEGQSLTVKSVHVKIQKPDSSRGCVLMALPDLKVLIKLEGILLKDASLSFPEDEFVAENCSIWSIYS